MAMLCNPCGDIDAIAHQVAVALLDHIAEMDADPKFDALVRRDPSIALDHRSLDFNGAVHCVDDAPELDNCAIAGALDDPAVVHGDGRIDQVAAERPQPRQNPVLVGSGKPRIADDSDTKIAASFRVSLTALMPKPVTGRSGTGMAALPCCTKGRGSGSAAPRVDWPVYPRHTEHNTVAEGGNRRWAETARQNAVLIALAEADQSRRGKLFTSGSASISQFAGVWCGGNHDLASYSEWCCRCHSRRHDGSRPVMLPVLRLHSVSAVTRPVGRQGGRPAGLLRSLQQLISRPSLCTQDQPLP